MSQQDAQQKFAEEVRDIRLNTEYPHKDLFEAIPLLSLALRHRSPVIAKLSLKQFASLIDHKENYTLNDAAFLINVLETSTAHQLELSLIDYIGLQELISEHSVKWSEIFHPLHDEAKKKLDRLSTGKGIKLDSKKGLKVSLNQKK